MNYLLFSARELYPSISLDTPTDNLSWVQGTKFSNPLPELKFRVDGREPITWCDYIRPAANIPLFSPRMREILESAGVENVDYYDATITHNVSGEVKPYFAANVIGLVRGMDRTLSEYEPFDDSDLLVEEIEKLVLDEQLFHGVKLCRLAEFFLLIVADESIKAMADQVGTEGVLFIQPEEWDGFAT